MTMNLTLMSQAILAILCLGVIVQAMRLMRRLRQLSNSGLESTVAALDRATGEARTVLDGLRQSLGGDGADVARQVLAARTLSDELGMLIGIANSMADRLADTKPVKQPTRTKTPPASSAKPKTASAASAKGSPRPGKGTRPKTASKTVRQAASKTAPKAPPSAPAEKPAPSKPRRKVKSAA